MSFLRKTCRSLLSQTLRRQTQVNSRFTVIRTATTRSDEQALKDLLDTSPAPSRSPLKDIAGDLESIADSLDEAVEPKVKNNETPNVEEEPPRAPNSNNGKAEDKRKASKSSKKAVNPSPFSRLQNDSYTLHAQCSNNNTILGFSNSLGKTLYQVSAGMCGFKHVQRSTYEAGYQCAVRMFERIAREQEETGTVRLEIVFKGRGMGRDALQKALMMSEGELVRRLVIRLTDKTPIKIGGVRAQKARRM